jgi:hypothetical protein
MRGAVLAIFVIGLCALSAAEKISFTIANKAEILERAENVPAGNQSRAEQLKAMFTESGCNNAWLSEQKWSEAEAPNIICRLPGETSQTIIVGAHYESTSAQRPVDNWSAAVLLPSIFQALRPKLRHHRIIFVAFADHGNETAGADFFVAHMSRSELDHVDAMVNLDALGFSPTKVWTAHSDKDLMRALVTIMYALKIPASQVDIESAGATDSAPFAARHVPQITIHSMTQANLETGRATQFRPANYYDTYRLVCGYVAFLDESLKPRPR